MTWPKRKRSPPKVKVVDPLVKSIDEQLEAYKQEQATKAPPMFAPEAPSAFAGPPRFAPEVAVPEGAFAASIDPRAVAAFGAGRAVLPARTTDAFKARKPRAQRRIIVQRVLMPPPVGPPRFGRLWLPAAEVFDCFDDSDHDRAHLWAAHEGLNFTAAAEANGYRCAEDEHPYEAGHELVDGFDYCRNSEHFLYPFEDQDFAQTLVNCTNDDWEGWPIWEVLLPLLVEIRDMALAEPRRFIEVPEWLDPIYRFAGYPLTDIVRIGSNLKTPLLNAIDSGVHDEGLAAAYADVMARHFPLAFGEVGKAVEELLTLIHMNAWLPEPAVEQHIVFEQFREPREYSVSAFGKKVPMLIGKYGINRVTYHSALTRLEQEPSGYVGWRTLWMVPVESWTELLPEGVVLLGGDEDDYE